MQFNPFKAVTLFILISFSTQLSAFSELEISNVYKEYFSEKGKSKTLEDLNEFSKMIRAYAPDFHQSLVEDLDQELPLFGLQLTNLHKLLSLYLDIQKKLLEIIKWDTSTIRVRARAGLMAYYNFHDIYFPYYQHHRLRRYLNDEDSSYQIKRQGLYEALMQLMSWEQRELIKTGLKYRDEFEDHPVYSFFIKEDLIEELSILYENFYRKDLRNDDMVDLTNDLSRWFGNTVGAVRWRKGHLFKDSHLNEEIASILKPLDIITEKTYFALTDKLIPGHFGHNAVWLGTKEELMNLGVWNDPALVAFQNEIEKGRNILEVDRTGTHLKSLSDFMNVDEFAIMRLNDSAFNSIDLNLVYRVALSQMGKVYDFNFDVETTDRLVCSELLYQTFGSFNWPTEKLLNRVTISPDNVASLSLYTDSPIDLVYYVAEKKSGNRTYKDKLDLAQDIGKHFQAGKFYDEVEECQQTRRGRRCQTLFKELIYEEHDLPDHFPF